MNETIRIGIDGGGTKTELLAGRKGDESPVHRVGEESNLQLVGLERAVNVLVQLIRDAASRFDDSALGAICVGLSGAGRASEQKAVLEALAKELGLDESSIRVVSDAEIAVEAAFEGGSGVLIIAGTGSMACGRTTGGEFACAGGWGRILGDEGSGYAIGRAGLQAAAAAIDGGPGTVLVERIRDMFGAASKAELVRRVYGDDWPVQEFAPRVLEAAASDDQVADRILREQTAMLARRVHWLIRRREDSFDRRIALIGGLTGSETYYEALAGALDTSVPGWTIERASARPVVGALRLASATEEEAKIGRQG